MSAENRRRTDHCCRAAKINLMLEVYALVIGSFPTERVDCGKLPMRYREGRLNEVRGSAWK